MWRPPPPVVLEYSTGMVHYNPAELSFPPGGQVKVWLKIFHTVTLTRS